MTNLEKPIRRRTTLLLDNRTRGRRVDQVVVTLYPNGTIGFRPARRRREYIITLSHCYAAAIRAAALTNGKTNAKMQK